MAKAKIVDLRSHYHKNRCYNNARIDRKGAVHHRGCNITASPRTPPPRKDTTNNSVDTPLEFAALQDPRPPGHANTTITHHTPHTTHIHMFTANAATARYGDSGNKYMPHTRRATLPKSAASNARNRCSADCQQHRSHTTPRHTRCMVYL